MPRATTGLSYLVLILVILGSLVFTVFLTLPAWSSVREQIRKREAAIARREEKKKFLTNIDARVQELSGYARDALALSIMFPDRFRADNFLATLQGLASGAGVVVSEVGAAREVKVPGAVARPGQSATPVADGEGGSPQVPAAAPAASVTKWETQIAVQGTYPQVRAFFRELERTLLLTDIGGLELTAVPPQGEIPPGTLSAELTLQTYTLAISP